MYGRAKMLTTNDLVWMRSTLESLLTDTCDIARAVPTSDGQGGFTSTWSTVYSGVACRLEVVQGVRALLQQPIAGGLKSVGEYTLVVPSATDLQANDHVTINSIAYNVESVNDKESWLAAIEAEVKLI